MTEERPPDLLDALRAVLPLAEMYVRISPPSPDYEQRIEDARAAITFAEEHRTDPRIIRVQSEEERVRLLGRRRSDRVGLTRNDVLGIMAAIIYANLALKPEATDIIAAQALAVDEAKALLGIIETLEGNAQ